MIKLYTVENIVFICNSRYRK